MYLQAAELYCYFAASTVVKYCDERICMSVQSGISKVTCPNFTKFSAILLWTWLAPSPLTVEYVMYFHFCVLRHVCP